MDTFDQVAREQGWSDEFQKYVLKYLIAQLDGTYFGAVYPKLANLALAIQEQQRAQEAPPLEENTLKKINDLLPV